MESDHKVFPALQTDIFHQIFILKRFSPRAKVQFVMENGENMLYIDTCCGELGIPKNFEKWKRLEKTPLAKKYNYPGNV